MPGINLLLSRRAVRFWRTLAVLVVAYLRRLARIWGPQRLLRLLSCQWGPSYQTGAASPFCTASLDAPTYPRVWNLKPPSWVEIKSQQLHVALGFKRRSFFFRESKSKMEEYFQLVWCCFSMFFHVFPPFPAFQLGRWPKDPGSARCTLRLGWSLWRCTSHPEGHGVFRDNDDIWSVSISIFIYIYIYLYLCIYMFVHI